jgi:hypothetical protein
MEAKQTKNGKAFEYSLARIFYERLQNITKVKIVENSSYAKAQSFFDSFDENSKSKYLLNASFAANLLIDLEPKLYYGLSSDDILEIEIMPDKAGIEGDVRDLLMIRSLQKWEIGVSAKNNHKAVKHQRLSRDLDFGKEWVGQQCSSNYLKSIEPVFDLLLKLKNENCLWREVKDKSTIVYQPLLEAFKNEVELLNQNIGNAFPASLIKYLIGNKDFYKVIKGKNKVEIQAFNLYGTLNQPSKEKKSIHKVSKLKLPDRLIEVVFKKNSKTTLLLTFNEGWQFSFRIHSASKLVEPSLKFDVNLVSTPQTLFSNHLLLKSI